MFVISVLTCVRFCFVMRLIVMGMRFVQGVMFVFNDGSYMLCVSLVFLIVFHVCCSYTCMCFMWLFSIVVHCVLCVPNGVHELFRFDWMFFNIISMCVMICQCVFVGVSVGNLCYLLIVRVFQ